MKITKEFLKQKFSNFPHPVAVSGRLEGKVRLPVAAVTTPNCIAHSYAEEDYDTPPAYGQNRLVLHFNLFLECSKNGLLACGWFVQYHDIMIRLDDLMFLLDALPDPTPGSIVANYIKVPVYRDKVDYSRGDVSITEIKFEIAEIKMFSGSEYHWVIDLK